MPKKSKKMKYDSHYKWLDANLKTFLGRVGINDCAVEGLIVCHGDKAYSYKYEWEDKGVHFYHGVALFLMSYLRPYSSEVRNGKVDIGEWVIAKYEEFKHLLPGVEE